MSFINNTIVLRGLSYSFWQGGCFFVALSMICAIAAAQPLATESSNDAWHFLPDRGEAIYTGNDADARMVLDKSALAKEGLQLSIQTDAAAMVLTGKDAFFQIDLAGDTNHELRFTPQEEGYRVFLNDEPKPRKRGAWIKVLKASHPTASLTFKSSTYVNADFDEPGAPGEGAAAEVPAADEPTATTSRSTDSEGGTDPQSEGVLARVRPSVFEVRATVKDTDVVNSGTGFVIDEQGFAVTNFHVIQGASSATATFSESQDEPIELELWAIAPRMDLALLRIPREEFKPSRSSIRLAEQRPAAGTKVWAIGFPKGLGYTVTRGVVNGIREYKKLPRRLREYMDYSERSVWIQTDATINSGNSGGPLVDDKGRVVAINTWQWLEGSNLFFALSIEHVADLLSAKPDQPIGFEQMPEQRVDVPSPRGSFPRIEIERTGNARAVRRAATRMRAMRDCRQCSGSGTITVRVRTGSRDAGTIRIPTHRNETERCDRCGGHGYPPEPALYRLGTHLAKSLARLPREARNREQALEQTTVCLRQVVSKDPAALARQVNDEARKMFLDQAHVGDPVIAVARIGGEIDLPQGDDQLHAALVGNRLVLLANARINDYVRGDRVILGGLYAGRIDSSKHDAVAVVQHGFIVGTR